MNDPITYGIVVIGGIIVGAGIVVFLFYMLYKWLKKSLLDPKSFKKAK
jgi:membrane-associated phospholipid phosphatase